MLYFELLGIARKSRIVGSEEVQPGIYARDIDVVDGVCGNVPYASERIWCEEDNGHVYYVKHRNAHMNFEVDMKEFLFIKLKAKVLE